MAVTIKDLRFSIYLNNADAKKSAIEMQSQLQKVGDAMQELSNQGKKDTPEYKEKKKAFDDLKASMEANKLEAGLLAMSWGELNKLQKVMANDKSRMIPDSAEWKKLGVDIGVVKGRMAELKGTATETQSSLSKMMEGGVGGFLTSAYSWAAAGIVAVASFFNEYTDDAVKAEKSMQRLSFAVKKVGGGSDSDLEKMAKQAEELMGIFSHEEIETTATQMINFGLSTAQVLKLMPLMVDAAAASGQSLEDMATAVDKGTVNGVMARSALGKLGLAFKDTGSKAENLRIITEGLTKFQGGNTEMMKSQWGQLQNLKIRWEEVKEAVGNGLLKVWIPLVDVFSKISIGMSEFLSKPVSSQMDDERLKVNGLAISLQDYNLSAEARNKIYNELKTIAPSVLKGINDENISQKDLNKNLNEYNDLQIKKIALKVKEEEFIKAGTNYGKALNNMINAETEAGTKAQEIYEIISAKQNSSDIGRINKLKNDYSTRQIDLYAYLKGLMDIKNKYVLDENSAVKNSDNQFLSELGVKRVALRKSEEENQRAIKEFNDFKTRLGLKDEVSSNQHSITEDGSLDKAAAQKKKVDEAMKSLETKNLNEITVIETNYRDGKIKTEFDYNKKLLNQQDNYDSQRKNKLKDLLSSVTDPGVRLEINKQIADIDKLSLERQVKQVNDIKKIILDADPEKAENEAYKNRLRELGFFQKDEKGMVTDNLKEEKNLTEDQKAALILLEKQHAKKLEELGAKEATLALEKVRNDSANALKELSERRITENMTVKQYNEKKLAIELEYLKKELLIKGLSAIDAEKIATEITNKEAQITNKGADDYIAFLKKYGIDDIKTIQTQKEIELKLLADFEKKKLITHKQAIQVQNILDAQAFEERTKTLVAYLTEAVKIEGEVSNVSKNFDSAETQSTETKYDKQIAAAKKAGKDTTALEQQKTDALNKIKAKNADKDFVLTVAQITAQTALAAIAAYYNGLKVPIIGGPILGGIEAGLAVAYGASQIAVASSARDAAKSGYFTGGYTTGATDDSKPVGTVHANEFVTTAKGVRNPSVRKFLDVFNAAQMNGTIHLLNTTQILEKVRAQTATGYQAGGYVQTNNGSVGSVGSEVAMAIISENAKQMRRLNDHLDNGIHAINTIAGDTGLYKKTQDYEKMLKNVSRQP